MSHATSSSRAQAPDGERFVAPASTDVVHRRGTQRQAAREAHAAELAEARRRLVSAADRERERIERDLHDGAQQRLVALAIKLALLEERADVPTSVAPALASAREDIEAAIEEIRRLAHGIYPAELSQFGLSGALSAIAREMPFVHFQERNIPRFSSDVESAVYFCCLEALQNAAKHAGAGVRVDVRLRPDAHAKLEFEVVDDGVGFDAAAIRDTHGIAGMRDRLEAIGGELTIASVPGAGTSVIGRVPATPRHDPRHGQRGSLHSGGGPARIDIIHAPPSRPALVDAPRDCHPSRSKRGPAVVALQIAAKR